MALKSALNASKPRAGVSGKKEQSRILIVDDEAAILFAYRRLLEGGGYMVDVCETLDEAVGFIMTHHYFAVITDIRLTGSDSTEGLTILASVRDRQPQAKMIVITGYGGKESVQDAIKLGASFYFKKPLEPSVVLETLRHLREDVNTKKEPTGGNLIDHI
jgi:two-component system response regulator RegA